MQFINLTPHEVNVYSLTDCIDTKGRGYILAPDARMLASFPPSGEVARATQQQEELTPETWNGQDIPICRMTYGEPVGLPDPVEGIGYIVSALTANAAKAAGRTTHDLFLTSGLVRDEEGKTIGCTGFAKL